MLDVTVDSFGYRRGREILGDVRISLTKGRTVLLGPNGAGKTTLLMLLAGVHAFRGRLSLDGVALDPRRRSRRYRTSVGWLPQDVVPFPALTAREHVAYVGWLKGMTMRDAWNAAEDALHRVGLAASSDARASRLSGGQTRRLGIAGVLVHDAGYLLLDEPTAGLDPRERERLLEILRSVEQERAVLVSTHDTTALIDPTATVVVLDAGRVRFSGSHASFIAGHPSGPADDPVRSAYSAYVSEA